MRRILIFLFSFFIFHSSISHAERWDISFVTPAIVRVQWSNGDKLEGNNTGVCVYSPQNVDVKRSETKDEVSFRSSKLTIVYSKSDGSISFRDNNSKEILRQLSRSAEPVYQENVIYDEKSAHIEETANGKVTVRDVLRRDTIGKSTRFLATFTSPGEKAVYGLGCQMEDYMNLQGKTLFLTQHNLKVQIPVLVSTNGYGLLFDAGCAMKYTSSKSENGYDYTMQLEAAKELDYYFISSPRGGMEGAIAGYRYLTGKVSMMPRYLFGYTQSKERYTSSADIISTLKEYRRRHVPIDMIVQDWNYWPQGWGYLKMDKRYYPDPKALADSVHQLHAKLMVSIWPNPQGCPEADDFKARGMMLPNDVYDAFSPEARKHYWKYVNDEFFSRGFDAWWCDSSEPLDGDWNHIPATTPDGKPYGWNSQEYRWQLNKDILSASLGAERSSLYSLYHSKGIYENQRSNVFSDASLNKRVVNLTRSSFAGQQRYGTIVWNGDTHASWQSFRDQIPAGLNFMATGNPYWTVDVGCFFVKDDGRRWFYKGEFPDGVKTDAYKEYYVRMFQWATFLPVLRSHGTDAPREIWQFITEDEKLSNCKLSDCKYAGAILKMLNFRYAHIPYIYSMAAAQSGLVSSYANGASMARPLAFDFSGDDKVLDLKDEYMFGNYLVCPVTHPLSETTTRKVYLPKGITWFDYWSGKQYTGGHAIDYNLINKQNVSNDSLPNGFLSPDNGGNEGGKKTIEVGVGLFPLFVRSGSIIPTTEPTEYTEAQVSKPITINIYPGEDAEFTLYEDEGDSYNYEKGAYSLIPVKWNDDKHTLTIDARTGSFDGMQTSRQFIIHVVGGASIDKHIKYNGKKTSVKI